VSKRKAQSDPEEKKAASRSGGVNVDADQVHIEGDVVGRDKIEAGQYVERQTNINLPRAVQIAVGVGAIAIVVIALSLLLAPQPVVANGDFGSGNLDGWEVLGAVTVVKSDEPGADDYYAQIPTGSSIGQSVAIPEKNPVLTLSYRSNASSQSRGIINILVNEKVYKRIEDLLNATEWRTGTYDLQPYAGQLVKIRIEYDRLAARSGGVLAALAMQGDDAVWIDRVEIASLSDEAIAQITLEPSDTVTPIPTSSATATALPPTETSRPTATPTARSTSRPTATTTRTSTPVATQLRAVTDTLTFTWREGVFRQAGQNASGQGIWAREITVEPNGGQPPYTVVFAGQPQTDLSFEAFGLYCEGQRAELIVQSSDGQSSSELITIQDPICPTHTPTPTPTRTRTPTSTFTPSFTSTPTPTEEPLADLPISDGYLITIGAIDIQGQGRRAQASPGGSVTVSVDYFISDPECPGCIDQILIGIADDLAFNEPMGCVYNGQPGSSGVEGVGQLTFTAPTTPGNYYVRFHYGQDFSCAFGWWGVGGKPGSDDNLGLILVR
jgi:hypothetical protein